MTDLLHLQVKKYITSIIFINKDYSKDGSQEISRLLSDKICSPGKRFVLSVVNYDPYS
jgi:hypothetical protein